MYIITILLWFQSNQSEMKTDNHIIISPSENSSTWLVNRFTTTSAVLLDINKMIQTTAFHTDGIQSI